MFPEDAARSNAAHAARAAAHAGSTLSRWRGSLGALCLASAVLGVVLPGCDDIFDDTADRSDGVWRGSRDDAPGRRGYRGGWHRHRRGVSPAQDAGARDGGVDAGFEPDAGPLAPDAGGVPVTGANDAGELGAGAADGGLDPSIQALSDGQILLVADTLLVGSTDAASAARAGLADPEALAFAEQLLDQYVPARGTLRALGQALGTAPAESTVAAAARGANDALLEPLSAVDAGALDVPFINSQLAAHGRALEQLAQLIAAADAPPLRAQLSVLQALEQANLERAQAIAAAL